jgi:RNA-binding protein NOB1
MLGPTPPAASSKPLEYLVLDAGALIRGHGLSLYHKAKKVVTVPDVLMEIRDSKSRELLEKLPFEIEERMPSQSSINAGKFLVAKFDWLTAPSNNNRNFT